MNPRMEWVVPVLVGLAVGLLLWSVQPHGAGGPDAGDSHGTASDGGTTSTRPAPPPDIVVPFASGWAGEGRTLTFIVLAPHGAAQLERNLTARDPGFSPSFDWQGDHVAFMSATAPPPCSVVCHGASHGPGWPLPVIGTVPANDTGPRLFHDGYNATRVTAYVFDEAGLLLASNANDTARFTLHGDFIQLPSTAWYLGANRTAPDGTTFLPGLAQPLVDRVRPLLDGLPVGGVASTRSNAYVALFGSLFVTVRLDDLLLAP